MAIDTYVPFRPSLDLSIRLIQLDNELRAVVISDPATEKAAAALAVRVGKTVLLANTHFCVVCTSLSFT